MTAKEKAKELVRNFAPYCTYDKDGLVVPLAKQCALIAVDLIISELSKGHSYDYSYEQNYWQSVKQEIQKL